MCKLTEVQANSRHINKTKEKKKWLARGTKNKSVAAQKRKSAQNGILILRQKQQVKQKIIAGSQGDGYDLPI